jgi:hypothetical protein
MPRNILVGDPVWKKEEDDTWTEIPVYIVEDCHYPPHKFVTTNYDDAVIVSELDGNCKLEELDHYIDIHRQFRKHLQDIEEMERCMRKNHNENN